MADLLARLKERKLVQWAIAYVAGAWAVLQVLQFVAGEFGWPGIALRIIAVVLAIGFFVALVLAWYHGERGAQRVGGIELLMLAALLVITAVAVTWVRHQYGGSSAQIASVQAPRTATGRPVSAAVPPATPAVAQQPAPQFPIAAQPIPAKSVAVLPFQNMSADKNNAYFADGMQDLILTKLADIGDLKVISRTSTLKYASHPDDLKTIGQQLGVATILEGSVQKAGKQVLINVQLIDVKTDSHIWAVSYTRTLDNVFGVEGEVADKIAKALDARLSAAQTAQLAEVPTTNPAAYDLFLRAEYQANRGDVNINISDWKAAVPLYRQALARDPAFALAYARLSFVESELTRFNGGERGAPNWHAQARADAEQALKLAPNLPASKLALGFSIYYGQNDFAAALKAFDEALVLRPNDADALEARGLIERRMGRFDAALASLTQAMARNPRSSALAYHVGESCMMLRRYADAETWFQRALALDPNNLYAQEVYARAILLGTGDLAGALAAAQGDAPILEQYRSRLLGYQRHYHAAIALAESVPQTPDFSGGNGGPKPLRLASLYELAGDKTKAQTLYAQALTHARAQLARSTWSGLGLVFPWQQIAKAEIGLGHTAQGLRAIAKVQAISAAFVDHVFDPMFKRDNAILYAQATRPDLAVPLLAKVLTMPGGGQAYSPALLWLDPVWDPIRKDPRFQALLQQYAKYKPAVTYDNPPTTSGAGHG